MAKKQEVVEESVKIEKKLIGALPLSFGQEDLNKMVDKINEIILQLNGVV